MCLAQLAAIAKRLPARILQIKCHLHYKLTKNLNWLQKLHYFSYKGHESKVLLRVSLAIKKS